MNETDLLMKVAQTLKGEVGPATEGALPKSQAFMASVVLEKLSKQIAGEKTRVENERRRIDELAEQLILLDVTSCPADIVTSVRVFEQERSTAQLCVLIRQLYDLKESITSELFEDMLRCIRKVLRELIDSRLEYSK
jgi:uncharacterized coiled-coil protein SlyX